MSALHLAALLSVGVAWAALALAHDYEPRSEERAVYAVYGWICAMAAVAFFAIAWWIKG